MGPELSRTGWVLDASEPPLHLQGQSAIENESAFTQATNSVDTTGRYHLPLLSFELWVPCNPPKTGPHTTHSAEAEHLTLQIKKNVPLYAGVPV